MARLVPAKCPTCGGGLTVPPGVEWVTCGYCHTSSFVHREQRKAPQVPPVPHGTAVIRVPPAKGLGIGFWLFIGMVTLAVGAYVAASTLHVGGLGRGALIGQQFLTDLNGDGIDDVVFHAIHVGGSSDPHLCAIDGATGATLWQSDGLLKQSQGEVVAAVPGGLLALVGGTATLLDGRTGVARLQTALPEKAEAVCSLGDGYRILGRDGQFYSFDDKTGAVLATGKAPPVSDAAFTPPCSPVPNDNSASHGGSLRRSMGDRLPELTAMDVDSVLRSAGEPIDLLVGKRAKGTGVPMFAAKGGGHVLWASDVPPSDPMNVVEGPPTSVALAAGRALALYFKTNGEPHVTAFALSGGKRLWDVALSLLKEPGAGRIAANGRYAYVWVARGPDQAFYRLSMDTGHVDWSQ